jgi:hypothetical protein
VQQPKRQASSAYFKVLLLNKRIQTALVKHTVHCSDLLNTSLLFLHKNLLQKLKKEKAFSVVEEHNGHNIAQMTQVTAPIILFHKCLLHLVLHYCAKNANQSQENEVE